MYIIDADDFYESNSKLDVLLDIKNSNSNFKITLFTILGKCSKEFINTIKTKYSDWIDLVPHGWLHETSRECEHWKYDKCEWYIKNISQFNLTKGFKAPGWQISDDMYKVLLKYDYWVADQEYNKHRIPKELKAYYLDSNDKLHFHIGNLGGKNPNEIELFTTLLKSLKGECEFIKDAVNL